MAQPQDEDIVVHDNGKYYIITKAEWQKTELKEATLGRRKS